MKKVLNIFSVLVILITVVFLASVTVVNRFGITPYSYKDGALIYVMETDVLKIKPGDRVTYKLSQGNGIATNIVEKIDFDAGLFYVDGSSLHIGTNSSADELVAFETSSVIGKTLVTVPYIGYAVDYISDRNGFTVLLVVIMCFMVLAYITAPRLWGGKPKKQGKGGNHNTEKKQKKKDIVDIAIEEAAAENIVIEQEQSDVEAEAENTEAESSNTEFEQVEKE